MFDQLSSIESSITSLLSRQYPLSQKDILEKIEEITKKKYSVSGLQRALSSLVQRGILHKHSKYYQLRTDRLLDEKKKVQAVLDRYIEASGYHLFLRKEVRYFAESLSQMDYLWNAVIEQWFNFYPAKIHTFWQQQPVPWFPLMHSDEERRIFASITEHCTDVRTYSIESPISTQVKPIYTEKSNSNLLWLDKRVDIGHAYAVFGDHILETKHPEHIVRALEELSKGTSDSIPFHSIIELSVPGSYEIIISKDAKKAERYRQLLLRSET
jgi:hypothetical protein